MKWYFQSTPHLSGKANKLAKCSIRGIFLFQSTPHLSGKANSEIIFNCISSHNVSIHASPQRQGEHHGLPLYTTRSMFQSTPHLSGKANTMPRCRSAASSAFQSTPHLSGKANPLNRAGLNYNG